MQTTTRTVYLQRKRRRTRNKILRTIYAYKNLIAVIALSAMLITLSATITIWATNYQNSHAMRDFGRTKFFTSYTVQNHDTLWDISSEMIRTNPEYPDVKSYMNEVISINDLTFDGQIKYGEKLILPYFSENVQ